MQLLIDIGNTRIKWAFDSGNALHDSGEIVHRDKTAAAAMAFVSEFTEKPDAVFALNVAGIELENSLQQALAERFGLPVQMVCTTGKCGDVTNGYTSIEQLGADRWAALVGAWHQCRRAVVVVDVGTAITIDLVAADGRHLGGIIVPGIDLMRLALNSDTSDIGGFAGNSKGPVPGRDWFGRDTLSAVQRGTLFNARAVIERAIEEFAGEGDTPAVFVTGGDAELVVPLISTPVEHRPLLVLEGLRLLVGGGS
ncbi:MAG: type III pantothenate kinase [Gammaproteobacteria bacterium]|jgi:type III pantothenate kinase|nr:type III pantothenate kinase [Gammaproteobacteria bacterium]MDP6616927.1 type III pantothenate kinase [Gammaproteobacteria bacterium]MDP6696049.1 type III pantothenate kinase [Gammaproteobacteria bacterium]